MSQVRASHKSNDHKNNARDEDQCTEDKSGEYYYDDATNYQKFDQDLDDQDESDSAEDDDG